MGLDAALRQLAPGYPLSCTSGYGRRPDLAWRVWRERYVRGDRWSGIRLSDVAITRRLLRNPGLKVCNADQRSVAYLDHWHITCRNQLVKRRTSHADRGGSFWNGQRNGLQVCTSHRVRWHKGAKDSAIQTVRSIVNCAESVCNRWVIETRRLASPLACKPLGKISLEGRYFVLRKRLAYF